MYSESHREHWISQKLSEYSWSEEYQTARDNLREAVKALDNMMILKKSGKRKIMILLRLRGRDRKERSSLVQIQRH